MYSLLILYPPQDNEEKFIDYYERVHIPLARDIPGIQGITYGFDLAGAGRASPYFCRFEADFGSAEILQQALGSPEGQAAAADVANFASGEPLILTYEKRTG